MWSTVERLLGMHPRAPQWFTPPFLFFSANNTECLSDCFLFSQEGPTSFLKCWNYELYVFECTANINWLARLIYFGIFSVFSSHCTNVRNAINGYRYKPPPLALLLTRKCKFRKVISETYVNFLFLPWWKSIALGQGLNCPCLHLDQVSHNCVQYQYDSWFICLQVFWEHMKLFSITFAHLFRNKSGWRW